MARAPLFFYTIYNRDTRDFPGWYVLRLSRYNGVLDAKGEPVPDIHPIACVSQSLAELRVYPRTNGCIRFARAASDDPVIMECWF